LVTAAPTFEMPEKMADQLGIGVRRVPVDKDGRLDLDAMAQAARWAGLVFLCNPNNPTSTLHPARAVADFIARVGQESPETAILVDEAYHDYVTDPGYATAVPLALEHPNVIVARRPTSCSSTSAAPPRRSRKTARGAASWSDASSRRSRRPTRASPSARSTRCSGRGWSSPRCSAGAGRPRPGR